MTRVTNFGIKRTFIQAGFQDNPEEPEVHQEPRPRTSAKGKDRQQELPGGSQSHITSGAGVDNEGGEEEEPPKKKRKRIKKKGTASGAGVKRDGDEGIEGGEGGEVGKEVVDRSGSNEEGASGGVAAGADRSKGKSKKKKEFKKDRVAGGSRKLNGVQRSELRRQKRVDQRNAETTCFACREKGHAARDCPVTNNMAGGGGEHHKVGSSKSVVGICYRCGSARHNLAKCKKPTDPGNPLPFASCFVCSGKGHLASSCPQNMDKGVYPNGGCCKICGETAHLAKDCHLRRSSGVEDSTAIFGMGTDAGADEDDFHMLKRKTREVDRDERREEKAKKMMNVKAGMYSGTVKAFGRTSTPIANRMGTKAQGQPPNKKVVYF